MNRIINTALTAILSTAALSAAATTEAQAGLCDNGACNTSYGEGESYGNDNFGVEFGFDVSLINKAGELAEIEDIIDDAQSQMATNPTMAPMYMATIMQYQMIYDALDQMIADDYIEASASGGVEATVLSNDVDILSVDGFAKLDDSAFSFDLSASVLGSETSLASFDSSEVNIFELEMTFVEANTTFMLAFVPVTISGDVTGTLGMNASVTASGGVELGLTPYANLAASASVGVGALCASAGVRGSLDLIDVSLPTTLGLESANCGVDIALDSDLELSTMSGSIEVYVNYCVDEWSDELVSWDGIELDPISVVSASTCI